MKQEEIIKIIEDSEYFQYNYDNDINRYFSSINEIKIPTLLLGHNSYLEDSNLIMKIDMFLIIGNKSIILSKRGTTVLGEFSYEDIYDFVLKKDVLDIYIKGEATIRFVLSY